MHLLRVSFRFIAILTTIAIIVFPSKSEAIEWTLFNTDSIAVNNYHFTYNLVETMDGFCTDDGFMYMDEGIWGIYNDIQLPIIEAMDFDQSRILMIMGDGTWSDGVYWYYPATQMFEVIEYILNPKFIHLHEDSGTYYIGSIMGLYYSTDGVTWEVDGSFADTAVIDMASFGGHLAIVMTGNIPGVYTKEYGQTEWNMPPGGAPLISSISFNENDGTLYGIFGGVSNSSGLWQSDDYGLNWSVISYSDNAHVVYWQWNNVFVGWNDQTWDELIVGVWDFGNMEFIFMGGENLPINTTVNSFGVNELIDCENIIMCTEDGAYMTCEIPTTYVDEPGYYPEEFEISAYPNPFNPTTNISVNLREKSDISLNIYNINGQLVKTVFSGSLEVGNHDIVLDGKNLVSGIYFVQVSSGTFSEFQKVVLLK